MPNDDTRRVGREEPIITKHGSHPPGVLPKNVQYVVLGGIALVVLVASVFSGRKVQQINEPAKQVTAPSQTQLTNLRQLLERQRQESEEAKKRLEAMQRESPGFEQPRAQPAAAAEVDPFAQKRRARAAEAPFASNFAVTSEKDEQPKIDTASQVAVRVEVKEEKETAASAPQPPAVEKPKAAGQFLPAREGDFFRVFEGTTVDTTLVNQLEGSFTGPVKCVVTKPLRSKDGAVVLIPEKSLFIGEAQRVEAQNQIRLAVSFKRLLLPNNYSIDLRGAPALDSAGSAGLKDKVDNHHRRTFGISGALGLLGGLALYVGRGAPYLAGVGSTMGGSATTALSRYLNAVPTLTIRKGQPVTVYFPNDLLLPAYRP